jgi:hypothetical protein
MRRSRIGQIGWRAVAAAGVGAIGLALPPAVHAATATGPHPSNHHYVTASLDLPLDPSSTATGFDLDGDGDVNNQLAKVFAAMASQGLDFPSLVESSITSGQVVMLHSLRTTSLTKAKTATWQVFQGRPKPHPVLTGGGHFAVDSAAPSGTAMRGHIKHGIFLGTAGTIPLQLALLPGEAALQLKVLDAHLKARCDVDGCSHAKLGGGITVKQLNHTVIPALATAMTFFIEQNGCSKSSPDNCSDQAKQMLQIFDTNDDYVISTHELKSNSLIQNVFAPDLDLLNATGHRGKDGVKESVSLGLGFTAKSAHFTQP